MGTVEEIKKGKIKVLPNIESIGALTIRFKNGKIENFDAIILATGYKSKLEEFIPNIHLFLDNYGNPKHEIGLGENKNIYFLGFDNFKPGGILGAINVGSETNTIWKIPSFFLSNKNTYKAESKIYNNKIKLIIVK